MAKIEKGLAKNQSIPVLSGKSPSVHQKSFDISLNPKLMGKAEREELLSNYYSDKKKYTSHQPK
jgi:hypothetical protein